MIGALLAASLICAAPTGADALWDDPQVRFVIVGELHGTVEAPAAKQQLTAMGWDLGLTDDGFGGCQKQINRQGRWTYRAATEMRKDGDAPTY